MVLDVALAILARALVCVTLEDRCRSVAGSDRQATRPGGDGVEEQRQRLMSQSQGVWRSDERRQRAQQEYYKRESGSEEVKTRIGLTSELIAMMGSEMSEFASGARLT